MRGFLQLLGVVKLGELVSGPDRYYEEDYAPVSTASKIIMSGLALAGVYGIGSCVDKDITVQHAAASAYGYAGSGVVENNQNATITVYPSGLSYGHINQDIPSSFNLIAKSIEVAGRGYDLDAPSYGNFPATPALRAEFEKIHDIFCKRVEKGIIKRSPVTITVCEPLQPA